MAFRWRAADGPLIVVFGSFLPHQTKKNVFRAGPSLAKHYGSAHGVDFSKTFLVHAFMPYPVNIFVLVTLSDF